MKRAALFLVASALGVAACGGDTPATTIPSPTPTTQSFSSAVVQGGTTSHTFVVSRGGTLAITLTAAGSGSTLVGLGVGIPNGNGAGCNLNTAISTAAGSTPQISVPVDPGVYCVRVYDVGQLTDTIGFAITINLP